MMNNNENRNKSQKRNKPPKYKFLFRRVIIVSASILILWLIVLGVTNGLKKEPINSQTTDPTHDTQAAGETTATSEAASETATSNETTTSNTSNETTQTTQSTQSTTNATNSATTESTSNTQTTTKEDAKMDFTAVSYYIQTLDARYQSYFESNHTLSAGEIVRDVNMNLDYDFYGLIENIENPNALSVICNKYYQLPSDFTPENLKSVPEGYFVADGKSYQLKQNALDAFILMSDAAKKEGLSLRIISAYRSNSYQANLYQKYKNNNGQAAADRFSARPGHSEHETGMAIDINDVAQAFENTKEFTWLTQHAHEYGYVLRYPNGMENVTGYMYEPWHYRYLGVDVATQLKTLGLTYDAYYAMYLLK